MLTIPVCLAAPSVGAAQERCPDAEVRVRFIREHLERDAANARTWSLGWGLTSVGVAAGSLTLAAFQSDTNARTGGYVWSGVSLLPAAILLLFPLRVMRDARSLDATAPADCEALARAEALLERDADQEAAGIAWYSHAVAIGFNVGLGASLGYALDDWGNNALSAGIGIALSELQILTQPTGALRARERYRAGALEAAPAPRAWLSPLVLPHTRGIAVAARF
ncbi:hypothetical protein LVJ94_50715 [Pendulispora rubella]|uniref:DUF2279 domain-containing protein n=1 Tax=Pendulispora rubella TaxID=2741070 RepID=A0ABZ2L8V1_9BACT